MLLCFDHACQILNPASLPNCVADALNRSRAADKFPLSINLWISIMACSRALSSEGFASAGTTAKQKRRSAETAVVRQLHDINETVNRYLESRNRTHYSRASYGAAP